MVHQQSMDVITQTALTPLLIGLIRQGGRRLGPPLPPALNRFPVHVKGSGNRRIALPGMGLQQDLSPAHQALLTGVTPHDFLQYGSL
jgi:hypothetical protein